MRSPVSGKALHGLLAFIGSPQARHSPGFMFYEIPGETAFLGGYNRHTAEETV